MACQTTAQAFGLDFHPVTANRKQVTVEFSSSPTPQTQTYAKSLAMMLLGNVQWLVDNPRKQPLSWYGRLEDVDVTLVREYKDNARVMVNLHAYGRSKTLAFVKVYPDTNTVRLVFDAETLSRLRVTRPDLLRQLLELNHRTRDKMGFRRAYWSY